MGSGRNDGGSPPRPALAIGASTRSHTASATSSCSAARVPASTTRCSRASTPTIGCASRCAPATAASTSPTRWQWWRTKRGDSRATRAPLRAPSPRTDLRSLQTRDGSRPRPLASTTMARPSTLQIDDLTLTRVLYADVTVPPERVGLTDADVRAVPWRRPGWAGDDDTVGASASAWVIERDARRIVLEPLQAADEVLHD